MNKFLVKKELEAASQSIAVTVALHPWEVLVPPRPPVAVLLVVFPVLL